MVWPLISENSQTHFRFKNKPKNKPGKNSFLSQNQFGQQRGKITNFVNMIWKFKKFKVSILNIVLWLGWSKGCNLMISLTRHGPHTIHTVQHTHIKLR